MESKKKLQFNDDFENFILCFSVSHGAIEHLRPYLVNFDATGSPCHELTSWDNSSSMSI